MKKTSVVAAGLVFAAVPLIGYGFIRKLVSSLIDVNSENPFNDDMSKASDYDLNVRSSRWAEQQNMETVTILSKDKTRLVGHLLEVPNAQRIMIMFHGWRTTWKSDCAKIGKPLSKLGCSILFAEERGQGLSGGKYMTMGVKERYDVLAWSRYIDSRYEGKYPIYLHGISMGATSVLMAGEFNLPTNVKGIIADSGYTTPKAIVTKLAGNSGTAKAAIYLGGLRISRIAGFKLDEADAREALKKCKVPVLFIHGSEDCVVPCSMSKENYAACNSRKSIYICEGAGHGLSFYSDRTAYINKIVEFFDW